VAEALVRAVLLAADDPLVEQFLEVPDGPDGPIGDIGTAKRGVSSRVNGFECALDDSVIAAV
jgi:hypothetical protein